MAYSPTAEPGRVTRPDFDTLCLGVPLVVRYVSADTQVSETRISFDYNSPASRGGFRCLLGCQCCKRVVFSMPPSMICDVTARCSTYQRLSSFLLCCVRLVHKCRAPAIFSKRRSIGWAAAGCVPMRQICIPTMYNDSYACT